MTLNVILYLEEVDSPAWFRKFHAGWEFHRYLIQSRLTINKLTLSKTYMEGPVDWSATGLEPQGIGDEPMGVRFLDLLPFLKEKTNK